MTKETPALVLPSGIVAVGPRNANYGKLQLARLERIERGVAAVRTLCDLPLQSYWDVREIAGREVCRACLAALET